MSSDTETAARQPNGVIDQRPTTPLNQDNAVTSSQVTLPSTEAPASPIEPGQSFKTENQDERIPASIIPSSLTPPPSSQVPNNGPTHGGGPIHGAAISSQRSAILSPPVTGLNTTFRRDAAAASEYAPPSPTQVVEASPEELRGMLQACIAEQAKLKMETAHHKLQYNLLNLQAEDDAKRAAVEHEMTRREVDALRASEHSRQARRELSAVSESMQAKYYQLRSWYEELVEENDALVKRLKVAKKVIQQKEETIIGMAEEKEMLLNRLRENREHFHQLCSPGGIFHTAMTPKSQTISTPVQHRVTPRQTPRSHDRDARDGGLAMILQVMSQENNSAPSTPTTPHRPAPRNFPKHTRGAQSLSSLPTTPTSRPRGPHAGLLPSVDLVPQTEPPHRYSRQYVPETPTRQRGSRRKSRESTISADDNEELARQALESVAAAAATSSFDSQGSHGSRSSRARRASEEEEEIYESQASQAASQMLRRDPRESFEVASSRGGSRDVTPVPTEKSAKLQAKIFGSVNKASMSSDKRKFSGGPISDMGVVDARREILASPTKKQRVVGSSLRDGARIGLGIQYGHE
ncbi:uncharacterized protein E0L32_001296 [Thyridium curvatum]|uniref:FAD-dependent oxidoreductase-like enzyme n=1 Tax=Thyridium curvatum TaxID=1093900 RepID=A0A507AYK2_9PEZI|nr:uncharacterized protein E0L32_001296 [Thyridium curvatum]TPX10099.1 hypothetical protein E0L32_001296 [Thyridium curvatum]